MMLGTNPWVWLLLGCLAMAGCGGGSNGSAAAPVDDTNPDNGPNDDSDDNSGDGPSDGAPEISLEQEFASLAFSRPVALLQKPGDNSRWYLLEQAGRVLRFAKDPNATRSEVVVDLRDQVDNGANEAGLLSMAFHSDFDDNGQVFLYHQISDPDTGDCCVSQLVRYTSDDGGDTLDPDSAQVLLSFTQPFENHFGGHLAFDNQGYLYLSIGDGGGAGDPGNRAQNTANLWGGMLRLDVDSGSPYAIPPDNPFAGEADFLCNTDARRMDKEAEGGHCPELYAWGLRNPWRWSFDRETGDLWLADVGQDRWEEINTLELGGNFGWRIREGANCFNPPSNCSTEGLIDPVAQIAHPDFLSITGGFLYRGSEIPALEGRYVFGDFVTGRLYSLVQAGGGDWEIDPLIEDTGLNIASFAEDQTGAIYLLNFGGSIFRLEDRAAN